MSRVHVIRGWAAAGGAAVVLAGFSTGCGDDAPSPTQPPTTSPTATGPLATTGEGISDIFSIAVDGSDLQRLTVAGDDVGYDRAAWSHDGSRLASSGPRCDDCAEEISLIAATGDHSITALTTATDGVIAPNWSPDDRRLVYVGGPANAVLAANVDGSDEVALIEDQRQHSSAVWSPNGRLIAFTTQSPTGGSVIEVMQPDGSARRRVTPVGEVAEQPAWSPDGRTIAFARQSGAGWAIATIPMRGGRIRVLTDPTQNAQEPTWSPDGRQIAFAAITDSSTTLAIMNANGTERRTLRTGTASASAPSWSPDGVRIAFTVRY